MSTHRKIKLCLLVMVAATALPACDTIKTRGDIKRANAPIPAPVSAPRDVVTEPPAQVALAPLPAAPRATLPTAPGQSESSAFLQKEAPRVGLILGAGGMKAFAHVGVLKEFARSRIPIAAVAGLEWGAAMGAIYAMQGQANEVEWKSFRLKESELPEASFLGGKVREQPIAILRDFLEMAFGHTLLEKNRVDFACPSYSPKTDKLIWLNKGSTREAIARCLAYPPFYLDAGGWMASPFAIEEAATFLRSRGANFVIFVNPLAQGELFPDKAQVEQHGDWVLWNEIRRHAGRPQLAGVNMTIAINSSGYPVTDFSSRRQLMDLGTKAAAEPVAKLVSKYGF